MTKNRMFIPAGIRKYRDRLINANKESWTVPGVGLKVPLAEKGKVQPTRTGTNDTDVSTPFVETNTKTLIGHYHHYQNSIEYKSLHLPYAETIGLRKGQLGFQDGYDVDQLKITLLQSRYALPERLQPHGDAAVELFKKIGKLNRLENGEYENNTTARVQKFDIKSGQFTLAPAKYFDQVGTNLTADWASFLIEDDLTTVRSIEPAVGGRLCSFEDSILANTLGMAAVLIDRNDETLIRIRGSETAIMDQQGGQFHCSASGVFELGDITQETDITFDDITSDMCREIENELTLDETDYTLFPVAFSRELVRAGKPQLFFVAKTHRTIREIEESAKTAKEAWEFIDPNKIPIDSPLYPYLNDPTSAPKELFSYESKMALAVASSYLDGTLPPFRL